MKSVGCAEKEAARTHSPYREDSPYREEATAGCSVLSRGLLSTFS